MDTNQMIHMASNVSLHCFSYIVQCVLTHLCRMYFPILINWMSPFPVLGLLGGIFHFFSNFKRNFCKQTVENMIRRHTLWHLIWFCTVCRCPTKRMLGLYGQMIDPCPAEHRFILLWKPFRSKSAEILTDKTIWSGFTLFYPLLVNKWLLLDNCSLIKSIKIMKEPKNSKTRS